MMSTAGLSTPKRTLILAAVGAVAALACLAAISSAKQGHVELLSFMMPVALVPLRSQMFPQQAKPAFSMARAMAPQARPAFSMAR
eukprot:CAMPEP_0184322080 /NCGR_PEP_ID=MMETSP1049-20130417/122743_1 /TAXON_ID=77928 /ORGANISM="Proteomonas sulcata, Strain CCMP704" /LENGTH=84 /DNA_ID=CAMNT_0026643103 /DNA_START=90 /DNA_END=341 /DNA_ORIENTATION=-